VSKFTDGLASHVKYTTMVGITMSIVIRLQESVVACILQPWSGGKDPDRYMHSQCDADQISSYSKIV
jgi:hypothetical protein